ncbi:glycosyltransferase family 9 protein [Cupriavidus basilensis]
MRNLCGQTSLDDAIRPAAPLSEAAVCTAIPALMHIAAALDRPQVAVFGLQRSTPDAAPVTGSEYHVAANSNASPVPSKHGVSPGDPLRCLEDIRRGNSVVR